jgi:hypothetical protein
MRERERERDMSNDSVDTIPLELKERIDNMSREAMAIAWRFAPIGDPMFQGAAGQYFTKRFNELGGMSPEISKRIGHE